MKHGKIFWRVVIALLFLVGCQKHWINDEIHTLNRAPGPVYNSIESAVAVEAAPAGYGEAIEFEITEEDPIILIGKARTYFKVFTFVAVGSGDIRISLVSDEVEKAKLRSELTQTRETGILVPAVYLVTLNGEVIRESQKNLEFENRGLFNTPRLHTFTDYTVSEPGTFFVLVTAENESLGSELSATNWSAALLEDLLEEGDVKRYATPTGKLSLTLSFKQ